MKRSTPTPAPLGVLLAAALGLGALATVASAQSTYTIEDVLSPGYPFELVSAKSVDRIGWLEYEKGMRNVYTAAAPDFAPVRLTAFLEDNGIDLTGAQISDDGRIMTFIRGHAANGDGWVANPTSDPAGAERAVWAVRTDGGSPWRVVGASSYDLSPDGTSVLYTRGGQVYRAMVDPGAMNPDPADAEPFFTVYGENSNPVWSPDGSKVAFVSSRNDHSYIGVYDLRNPSITYMAPGVDRDTSPTWSADGTRIAFMRRPGLAFGQRLGGGGGRGGGGGGGAVEMPEGMMRAAFFGGHDLEIWIADPSSGEGEAVWRNRADDDDQVVPGGIEWVGDAFVFRSEPGNWQHYFSIPANGAMTADAVELTPGEGFVEAIAYSPDGRYLYYSSNVGDIDRRDLWRVPTSGGPAEQLTRGDGIEHYPAVLASGDQVAILYADAKRPLSVALVPAGGGEERIITTLPDEFPLDAHVVPEAVTLDAEDGFEFYNQLFLPPDLEPGERRPALIFIHGGSRRQMLLGYHYRHFYHMAYAINQYFASQGYVVLSVNYRSGIGYGREFRTADDVGRQGNAEYRDIIAAGRYLQTRDDVDPDRVGLWGLSYGGILTAQGLARNSDVFKAGVDIAGVHLWGSSLDPEDTSFQSSSIAAIEGWTSPVLLIHGDDDRNVDFSQTVGLVQLLRAQGVPHELIVFPDDVHDSLLFHRWITTFEASDDFLQRALVRGERIGIGGAG